MSFQPLSPTPSAEVGETGERLRRQQFVPIPGYEIEYEIGRGGMATVYRAVQQSLGRQVAIKVLAREADDDDDFVQRFKKEGRILAQLLHPNIVTIYDVGISENNRLFLSIEYLSGGTLSDRMKLGLSFDSVVQITRAIAKALGYAHERGIVHRDVKPSNIMFRHDGTPVLTDFGVARIVESKTMHTMAGLTIGSPGYMSPEQAMGESASIQSDLYSLGVVIYEMLAGRRLYEAENPISVTLKHLHDPIPSLPRQYAHLQPVLTKLLAKKRVDRYKNAREFLDALNTIVPSDTGTQPKIATDIKNQGLMKAATGKIHDLVSNKKSWLILSIAGILILFFTIPFIFFSKPFIDQSAIEPPVKQLVDLSEQTQRNQQITTLLKMADIQRKAGLLAGDSKGDNAETTYQQVLAIDPTNAQALAGLKTIADQYEEQAKKQLDANALQESWRQIQLGLAAAPQHQGLLRLHQDVERQIAAIRLQKNQEEERKQSQLQAEQFFTQAQNSFQEGLLEISLVHIEQGLSAVPNHSGLLALRERVKVQVVEQQIQAEAERQQREEELLRQREEAEQRKAEKARQQAATEQRRQEAGQYLMQAMESRSKSDYTTSVELIEKGLKIIPNHEELLRLREEMHAQLAAEQQKVEQARQQAETVKRQQEEAARLQAEAAEQQKVEQARQQAETVKRQQEEAARLQAEAAEQQKTEQARQQAETVKRQQEEAARLQAEAAERQKTEQARQQAETVKRQQQADQYLAQALEARRQGDQTASLQWIEKGLSRVPDHADLIRLRQEMNTEIAAQKRQQAEREQREQEIAKLLKKAEAYLKAKRLTTPARNNAEATYQQVLKLDVGNTQAQAGLERIAQEYLQQAQQKRLAGALRESLKLIEKGLAVVPEQAELLRLREEVRAEGAAVQQRPDQRLEQQQQEKQRLEQQRKLEQQRQGQQLQEQRRLERQQEKQRLEQQRLEQQRQEQQRLESRRQEQQQLKQQEKQRLEQQRQEQQRQEQQRQEQQQKREQQRQEPPPESKPKSPSEPTKPRVFGTF